MNISPFVSGPNRMLEVLMRISMVSALRQTAAAVRKGRTHLDWTGRGGLALDPSADNTLVLFTSNSCIILQASIAPRKFEKLSYTEISC